MMACDVSPVAMFNLIHTIYIQRNYQGELGRARVTSLLASPYVQSILSSERVEKLEERGG